TIKQMQRLQHTTVIYLTEEMVNLAERLSKVLPGNLRRSFFCCTGSEANEGAMLLARLYTGKKEFIALNNGLHGRTYLTMSATAIPMWRADPELSPVFHFASNVWDENLNTEDAARESLKSIEDIIKKRGAENIAALITEPIQGNGGIITPPLWYFKELKK
ncbi:aminotransferase class III-fold pyridoxal phosphate-dependent enzyme, partial [Clostridium perfringens]|nr:aminotransferase class III-fold pyridoxal phosphate-dependent enzyme [Clostridium perfringens]